MVKVKFCLMLSATILVGACGQTDDTGTEASTIIATTQATASDGSQEQPKQITTWINDKKRECASDGFSFSKAEDYFKTADFNADGKTDYVLWEGGVVCDGRPASWFGNAGPPLTFLISNENGYAFYSGFSFYDLKELPIENENGRDVIKISGTAGGENRNVTWAWNGGGMSLHELPFPEEDARDTGSAGPSWEIREESGRAFAMWGLPESSADYSMECDKSKRTISLTDYWPKEGAGREVEIGVAGQKSISGKATYFTDEMEQDGGYVVVALTADSPVFTDLIAGETPLRVKWRDGKVDEVPNGPKLQSFLKKCRGQKKL